MSRKTDWKRLDAGSDMAFLCLLGAAAPVCEAAWGDTWRETAW